MSDTAKADGAPGTEHDLRHGVLGLFDSVIMGVAGSAPGYSIAGDDGACSSPSPTAAPPPCCTAASSCSASSSRSVT